MISAEQALTRLKEGNARFVNNQTVQQARHNTASRQGLIEGQAPFAIILGCADSRVPPELIFDQGLGDLFVIRVAGNVADTAVIASIEFALEYLGTSLLVVLGHESCGAVQAAISKINHPTLPFSPDLTAVVEMIVGGIRPLIQTPSTTDAKELETQAIQQNTQNSLNRLQAQSDVLREQVTNGQFKMVSAQYMLCSGEVLYFD